MRTFKFSCKKTLNNTLDDNGWIYKSRFKGKIGYYSLRTPVMKEVTYTKGSTVRYVKRFVFGLGFINKNNIFSGIALFDPHIRFLISALILSGVTYVSLKLYAGIIWSSLFYILIVFLSSSDDEMLYSKCKRFYETENTGDGSVCFRSCEKDD